LTTDFAQAFQNNQNSISDAVQKDCGPLVYPVMPFQLAKSRFFDARQGIYSVNVFQLERLNKFYKNLCACWCYHPAVFYAISQNVHKNRWMET